MDFIDLKTQQDKIKDSLAERTHAVLAHGRYIKGPEVDAIEEYLAGYTGAAHAIACGNGTDALMIALMALDIKAGDEVITTPFTFYATAEVMAVLGIVPVFVDIDPLTYNIDANLIADKITAKTKAIVPVSLYGQCPDMDAINAIAAEHDLAVIEDAAQSFGAQYKGTRSCNLSHVGTTSFFPSKPLGAYGDGGMMFTNDDAVAKRLRMLCNHGQEKRYYHTLNGFNSRLDTLQAAVLLSKFEIFDEEVAARERIGDHYTEMLKDHVTTPVKSADSSHVYAQYTIQVDHRDAFQEALKAQGIPTTIHYPVPLHFQPAMSQYGYKAGDFPLAEAASERVVSLPMHPYLSQDDQQRVVDAVIAFTQRSEQHSA
jgi:UDP-2-acetamido-2-deoxy-ribo-hexuluronate aminotransferase